MEEWRSHLEPDCGAIASSNVMKMSKEETSYSYNSTNNAMLYSKLLGNENVFTH
ncbi:hypothetical protein [Aliterella atlantica]|uniref:hypothetical protein n=1 Tax=Aliterella atlantica TaxID=1827278 RepID=UPI001F195E61|nr:hypothetical protein [Aliterella atlantica]